MFQSNLLSILSFLSQQQAQLVFIMTGWTSADVGTVASRWSKSEQRGYVPSTVPHRHAMYKPWNPGDAWHPHKQNEPVQTQESPRLCFCVQAVRRVIRFPDQLCRVHL